MYCWTKELHTCMVLPFRVVAENETLSFQHYPIIPLLEDFDKFSHYAQKLNMPDITTCS